MTSYDLAYYAQREGWRDWRYEAYSLLRIARPAPGRRVLEVGCGTGGLLVRLARRGAEVCGVDSNAPALEVARGRLPQAELVLLSALRLPWPDQAFDAVVAQHTIEHLGDPGGALAEWGRVLKPGGALGLVTPNAAYPDPARFDDPDHRHIYRMAELASVVEASGYRVTEATSLFPLLGPGNTGRRVGLLLTPLLRRLPWWREAGCSLLVGAVRL